MESNGNSLVNTNSVKVASRVIRALNHKLRQNILELIDQNKKMVVTDIYVKLKLEQSVASQHLAILRKEGLLKTERDGKFIHYSVDYTRLEEVKGLCEKFVTIEE